MARPPRLSNVLKEPIVFFCKDCELLVDVRPVGRKFVYKCAKCNTKNVAFGTEKAIRSFYRVKEESEAVKKEEKPAEKKEQKAEPTKKG